MRLTSSDGIRLRPIDSRGVDTIYKKLAAYEDAEEQGRLVILPCKVGTPVWSSVMCRFDENGEEQPAQWPFMISMMDEWGTGFFLSREEAEAKLREVEHG